MSTILAACLTGCAAPTVAPQASTPSSTTPPKPNTDTAADNKVVIMFPPGGAALTSAATQQLDLAARLFRDANPVVMFTTGYTDSSGEEFSNIVLSARRAEAVKRGLVARGLPPERLLIRALGASAPANATDPLAAENRRVVITWRLAGNSVE